MICSYCQSKAFVTTVFVKKDHEVLLCKSCGLYVRKQVKERPEEYWSTTFEDHKIIKLDTFKQRIDYVRKHTKGETLLDYGCGLGTFLEVARDNDYLTYGLEVDPVAKNSCEAKGLTLISHEQIKILRPSIITLWHVLEHQDNPLNFLKSLGNHEHYIVVEVPNINSFNAKNQKCDWWYLQDDHRVYFTPETLRKHLEGAGYHTINFRHVGVFLVNQQKKVIRVVEKHYGFFKYLRRPYNSFSQFFRLSDAMQMVGVKK